MDNQISNIDLCKEKKFEAKKIALSLFSLGRRDSYRLALLS